MSEIAGKRRNAASQFTAEELRQLMDAAPIGMLATAVNAVILALFLRNVADHRVLASWIAITALVTVARHLLISGNRRRLDTGGELARLDRSFMATTLLSGMVWAAPAVFLFPSESMVHQVFVAFVLGGMVVGAVGIFSVRLPVFFAFSLPVIVALTAGFAFVGDTLHFAMAAMIGLFGLLMCATAWRVNRVWKRTFRLRFENAGLVSHLTRAKETTENLNRELKEEIRVRTAAEEALRQHRERLAQAVEERTAELKRTNDRLQGEVVEREAVERELVRSRAHFQSLIEGAHDIVAELDWEGSIRYVNPAVRRITGYDPGELSGRRVYDVIDRRDRRSFLKAFRTLERGSGEVAVLEMRIRTKDGSPCILEATARRVAGKDDEPRIIVNARDITQRKEAEEEILRAEKLESIAVLAGGIAHDFNNLLTGILGNLNLASCSLEGESPLRERLEEAEKASLRARDLARQLLTFSRGGTPIKSVAVLDALIREAAAFALRGSAAACTFDIADDLRPVEVDKGQIAQVIQNLVINASQAMPDGGSILITAQNEDLNEGAIPGLPEGRFVSLSVRDTGTGIAPETIPRIFDPYFTTKDKGSGLGLATAYSVVRRHGGTITVDSRPGAGSVFRVYLPASGVPAPLPQPAPATPPRGGGRILVMDDEALVRDVLCVMLRELGYEAESVADGAAAVEASRREREAGRPFDAVIMDLTIPGGMGGREAAPAVRDASPGTVLVVSSGYSNDPVMSRYREHGFQGVVVKPYRISDLAAALEKALRDGG